MSAPVEAQRTRGGIEQDASRVDLIARVAHAAMCEYAEIMGLACGESWELLDGEERNAKRQRVVAVLHGALAENAHKSWCERRLDEGWRYGRNLDVDAKRTPDLLGYDELPAERRAKDALFAAIVEALS